MGNLGSCRFNRSPRNRNLLAALLSTTRISKSPSGADGDVAESGFVPPVNDFRFSNFDLLRIIAAICVIFSHSFGIVDGDEHDEPLSMLLGAGNILAIYGVYTFFIVSGFLITASFERSSLLQYVLKRWLRIFPGLCVCAIVTTIIALLVSGNGTPSYSMLKDGAHYIADTLRFYDTSDDSLQGVVFSSNDFGRIFNGSLWSLGPELLCYVGVAVLGVGGLLGLRTAVVALMLGLYTHQAGVLGNTGFVFPFFAAGAVLYFLQKRQSRCGWFNAWAAVGLLTGALLGFPSLSFALFGSWLLIAFATGGWQVVGATRFGDLSYGIYLYGWPVQQTIRYLLGDAATWWLVFLLAMPVVMLLGMISWFFIEKPALRLTKARLFR